MYRILSKTRKCGNCECISNWGCQTPRQSFSALITTPRQVWSRWTYPLPYYSVFAADTLLYAVILIFDIVTLTVTDFLLVIYRPTNWHPISCHFEVIADYCLNFGHWFFEPTLLRCLGATYTVHLGLIGKLVVNFLLVLNFR